MEARAEARIADQVAVLELTGRNGTNPMDERFVRDLDQAAATIAGAARDGRVDVVVIRALGRHFSVGGDLADLAHVADPSAAMTHMTGYAHRGIAALHALEVPVIARWQGAVAGGGIGLLLAADFVIAGRSASLTAGYSAVGLSPDAGVSWGLSRRLGPERALELLLSNRRLDVSEAVALGLASEVVDDPDLDGRVEELVARILDVGGAVLRTTKRLARSATSTPLEDQLAAEAVGIAASASHERFRAAVTKYAGGESDH
jgi:2-(1,2-epoxy-1,2-dihydrophenyl)acetyl-CoA isomerase